MSVAPIVSVTDGVLRRTGHWPRRRRLAAIVLVLACHGAVGPQQSTKSEQQVYPTRERAFVLAWSPHGSRLAVGAPDGIVVMTIAR